MTKTARFQACCGALLLLLCLLLGGAPAVAQVDDPGARWQVLSAKAVAAYNRGTYAEGIASAEQALALARSTFGDRDPRTLTSLNNLAFLYVSQGRSGEAEPLY